MTQADAVSDLIASLEAEADRDRDPADAPDVGIVMGSDSDLDVMMGTEDDPGAYDALTELGFEELTDYDDPPAPAMTTSIPRASAVSA